MDDINLNNPKEKSKASMPGKRGINRELEHWFEIFGLHPSPFVKIIFKLAINGPLRKKSKRKELSLGTILVGLVEAGKAENVTAFDNERQRCRRFSELFLEKCKWTYPLFKDDFLEELENFQEKSPFNEEFSKLEVFLAADLFAENMTSVSTNIFFNKKVKGEHLIITMFHPEFGLGQQMLEKAGIKKEDFISDWIRSLGLHFSEVDKWQSAFDFIGFNLNVKEIIEEKEKKKEKTTQAKAKNPDIPKEELGRSPTRTDEPASKIEDDLLGRDHLVKVLSEMIADEKQGTPFTVGLLGRWGSGKSTVMKMLKDVLKKRSDNNRFEFTEFNAWEYERTKNMEAGLAQEVVQSLVEPLNIVGKLRVRYEFALKEHGFKAKMLVVGLVIAASVFLGDLVWMGFNYDSMKSLGILGAEIGLGGLTLFFGFWKVFNKLSEHPLSVELRTYLKLPNYGEHLGLIPILKRHIKTLCQLRLGTLEERKILRRKNLGIWSRFFCQKDLVKETDLPRRLVVFVDDLDRCDPGSITKTLDAVRLVMDVENVIVIIGIDHRIAFRAVGDRYKDLAEKGRTAEEIARDYLGKILQLAIVLNDPSHSELKTFVNDGLFKNAKEMKSTPSLNQEENSDESFGNDPLYKDQELAAPETEINTEEKAQTDTDKVPQGTIEGSTEINKEENLWRKEIEFSIEEMDLFADLVEVFELNNPRQLLRLRNSYGLLKLLYGMRNMLPVRSDDENDSEDDKTKLMILLFWKEFEANHPNWAKKVTERWFENAPSKDTSENPIIGRVAEKAQKYNIGRLEFTVTGPIGISNFVERFVLPRAEGVK
jgi:hypothetical protein